MLRVALIQLRSGIDRAENVEAVEKLIRDAAIAGAEFIATPEMTTVLDRRARRLFEHLPTEDEATEPAHFEALAKELGVHLLIGSMAIAVNKDFADRKMANRSMLFGPDGEIARYDKLHLFDVDLPTGESWKESNVVAPGQTAAVAKTAIGTIGLSICYDIRFPHLYRKLAQAGAEILTVPAAFTVPTGQAHWETLLRARAIETGSYVIAPGQGGLHADGRETYGHSMVVSPWGEVLAEKPDNEPGILYAELDMEKIADIRSRLPSLTLDRPIDVRIFER